MCLCVRVCVRIVKTTCSVKLIVRLKFDWYWENIHFNKMKNYFLKKERENECSSFKNFILFSQFSFSLFYTQFEYLEYFFLDKWFVVNSTIIRVDQISSIYFLLLLITSRWCIFESLLTSMSNRPWLYRWPDLWNCWVVELE